MRPSRIVLCCALIAALLTTHSAFPATATGPSVHVYLTTADLSRALSRQPDLAFTPAPSVTGATIRVDDTARYQQIDGFGGALTDTSAWLLYTKLSPAVRDSVLRRIFDQADGIGISFLRVPMGASDFTKDGTPYTYDDVPPGQSDPALAHFSIQHDRAYIIPALRAALRINPALKLMANPWSPPAWMKQQDDRGLGGVLLASSYAPLAAYFVRFLQAYQAQGITFYAISPQNEPGKAADYPGMAFPAEGEARFIAAYLGPALAAAGLHPRILGYDSFWSFSYTHQDYPFLVMGDAGARAYLAGTAWHCYWGSPDVMTQMHDLYPGKDNYVTECASPIAHGDTAELIIASMRNWARSVLLWNVALDTRGGPKQEGGCPGCIAPVTVDQATGRVSYTRDYYQLGQASVFVHPGAYRIGSTSFVAHYGGFRDGCKSGISYGSHTVDDVAFQNSDGSIALLAYNAGPPRKTFAVRWRGLSFRYSLPACAAATFTWAAGAVHP